MGVGNLIGELKMEVEHAADCKGEPRSVMPVVDRNRCEAKARCVAVCPFNVFEIRMMPPSDRATLSFTGKLKAWAHGNRQAYVLHPADCHACQLCVRACPEGAIRLVPYPWN
jgi:NAD-dependent dihydropyrimidine dehydrogenase PreA subunit